MADDILRMLRALIAWFVVFCLLLFVIAMAGGLVSSYELALLFVVSIVLTVFALRAWDRSRARRSGTTPSV